CFHSVLPLPASFFSFTIPPPPSSTLFPYTTLFRSLPLPASVRARIRGMLQVRDAVREVFRTQLSDGDDRNIVEARNHLNRTYDRSEEHTSELQSLTNLVCRLLLEKKNTHTALHERI